MCVLVLCHVCVCVYVCVFGIFPAVWAHYQTDQSAVPSTAVKTPPTDAMVLVSVPNSDMSSDLEATVPSLTTNQGTVTGDHHRNGRTLRSINQHLPWHW